jgi:hypothetical protein
MSRSEPNEECTARGYNNQKKGEAMAKSGMKDRSRGRGARVWRRVERASPV